MGHSAAARREVVVAEAFPFGLPAGNMLLDLGLDGLKPLPDTTRKIRTDRLFRVMSESVEGDRT